MIEQNNFELLKLCYLLEKRRKFELSYQRALWRVSYYRKIKAKLDEKAKNSISPIKLNRVVEINQKIELARLDSLKKNRKFLEVKKRLRSRIEKACSLIEARTVFHEGEITGIKILTGNTSYMLDESEFKEKAEQYVA